MAGGMARLLGDICPPTGGSTPPCLDPSAIKGRAPAPAGLPTPPHSSGQWPGGGAVGEGSIAGEQYKLSYDENANRCRMPLACPQKLALRTSKSGGAVGPLVAAHCRVAALDPD